jgi:putative addiction module component (TIGR02574 family)
MGIKQAAGGQSIPVKERNGLEPIYRSDPFVLSALGIDQLSVGERLQLIDLIWDSLPEHVDAADVPAWHLAELANRRAEADASPGIGKPWREVLGELGAVD